MLFLQAVEPAVKLIDHTFNISPDTIYGLMAVGMLMIILALSAAVVYLFKALAVMRDKYELMAQSLATVIVNNSTALIAGRDEVRELRSENKESEARILSAVKEKKLTR